MDQNGSLKKQVCGHTAVQCYWLHKNMQYLVKWAAIYSIVCFNPAWS